jgi:hypothetical protein
LINKNKNKKKDVFYATVRRDGGDALYPLLESRFDIVSLVIGIEKIVIGGRLEDSSIVFLDLVGLKLVVIVCC